LAADLVGRHVAVILAAGLRAALAAKAATTTIPIVFSTANDPVQYGLVASFNRPGGNITGINSIGEELGPRKRLGLLHDLLPGASRFAILINPNPSSSETVITGIRAAAATIGGSIEVAAASTDREIDTAFASLAQKRIDALLVGAQTLFFNRRVQLVHLASYYRLPAMYPGREFTEIGGLAS
jgi:putative tryptophan/tyrosine transport system substrate-binding protein